MLGVLNQDWQLQIVATFQVFEMDRRQKGHSVMLNGQIAGVDGRLFVINRSSTRIFKIDYQLFEAATSLDAFESADLIGEEIARSVVGCFQGWLLELLIFFWFHRLLFVFACLSPSVSTRTGSDRSLQGIVHIDR